ncbi:MAG: DUF5522 domain-containing protein [Pseudomonadota bacterium]
MSRPDYWEAHEAACARGEATYADPETGYTVFTRLGLLERERCCGAGCRHCPFGHESVPLTSRSKRAQQPAWLSAARPNPDEACTLLFWSGGKDSYLALRALRRAGVANIALITTFDARSRIIAHQEIGIESVIAQAERLSVPLIGVPLHDGADYLDQIAPALELAPNCVTLAFGDLHLEHIRGWREDTFATDTRTAGLRLSFPLWQAEYNALLADLEASGAVCTISALSADIPGVAIGDAFDRRLIDRLPDGIDPFGENGEFHTYLTPPIA